MNDEHKPVSGNHLSSSLITHRSALVLFAHGARDPEWTEPFRDIARQVAQRRPDLAVTLAFLELQQPSLPDAIAALAAQGLREIRVAPLFMAQGGHLKNDLPKLLDDIRGRHSGLRLALLPAIGDAPELREAIAAWLARSSPENPA
ncbi:MAG: CbiX/SirB N-terminal domain-containing protein [Burkholderiales bacterium]|nr:CbiX/SirB N-terminal domain-containing protein [Burkholderiales bacterium]